ncbi:MAG: response regulator [Chloroflexi bacterium]|nr:response regulator [Chloroflexota bacterium]
MRRRPRILIAEDDRALVGALREAFQDDFRVEIATDGREAVLKARQQRPDAVIMDARMPVVDGYAACRELRRDPKTAAVPIILVTVDGEPATASAAFDAGATDFLPKPFSVSQLRARAETCLMRQASSALAN